MNDEPSNGGDEPQVSLFERVKESPRTVSALIIILIVAAAIYAFSGEEKQANDDLDLGLIPQITADDNDQTENPAEIKDEEGVVDQGEAVEVQPEEQVAATPLKSVSQVELQQQNEIMPEGQRQDNNYVETAQAGEGITHLARRAATRWLAENNPGYEMTNEQRIYIEDYIQNRLGTEGLSVGETRTISVDLITEAVNAAGQLNSSQLHNLSQYTPALT